MTLPRSDDLGAVPRPTAAERANIRANIRRLARNPEDAALLIDAIEDDR